MVELANVVIGEGAHFWHQWILTYPILIAAALDCSAIPRCVCCTSTFLGAMFLFVVLEFKLCLANQTHCQFAHRHFLSSVCQR